MKNNQLNKINCKYLVILLVVLAFQEHGFNVVGWNAIVTIRHYLIFVIILAFFCLTKISRLNRNSCLDKTPIFLVLWSLLTSLLCISWGGEILQEIPQTINVVSLILFYYINIYYEINEKTIIITFLIFGILTAIIQIIEQFYPSIAIFGVFDYDSEYYGNIATMRNNLFRLKVGSSILQMFCLFYVWGQLLKKITFIRVLMVLLFASSVYLYLTRQILISVAFTICFSYFFVSKKKIPIGVPMIFLSAIILIANYWEALFGDFIKDYVSNTYTTDIRQECISATLSDIFNNPITALFGHGHLETERTQWWPKGYYMSDIGFVGQGWYFGILWIYVYFYTLYKYLIKYRKYIPIYIKLFLISTGVISISIFPYTKGSTFLLWGCMLYICFIYTRKNVKLQDHE